MILLCTASDDYIEKYKPCISSQMIYCRKHGYTYKLIQGSQESRNWKRAKIDELENLLNTTEEDVCLIDGDCLIKDRTPAIDFLNKKKSIFYVNGKSGRLNSGFVYFKNNQHSKDFIKELKEKLKLSIPRGKGYFVTTEGENGHIIWLQDEWTQAGRNVFQQISFEWNCASPVFKERAYILHFTGPLKKEIYKYNDRIRSSSKSKKQRR